MKSATAVANGLGGPATKTTEKLSYTNATALFPFLLVAAPPLLVLYLYYAIVHGDGSVAFLLQLWAKDGFIRTTASVAAPYLLGSRTAWKIIGCYAAFELALMRLLPGKRKSGPPSPTGHVPVYTANGVQAYCVTLATFGLLTYLGVIDPGLVYDHLGEILGALNFSAIVLCWLLYFKGKYMPSNSDASVSGSLIFDYYWGTELYPRVLGKPYSNTQSLQCRAASMHDCRCMPLACILHDLTSYSSIIA